jgi:hypothetical protein
MKVRHYALLVACVLMAISTWPAAAIQLLDVLFLSDGSSVTGVIMEEEPGKALVLENEDGKLLEYRFKDIERIEKLFVDEEPLIQNRDVVYLQDGVVFRGTIVGRIPEKEIRLELENGQLLDFEMKEIFKICKEQVATGVVQRAVIKPKKAEKEEVEIKIQIALNQLRLKQDRLKQGGEATELESLRDEVDRLQNEIGQLEEQKEVVESEAAEEEDRFAAVESELGELRTELLAAAEGLEERIAACESPQVKERLEAKYEDLQRNITEVLQRAEVIALVEQPDPRVEEIELQNKTTDALALAQKRLWKDSEYEEQWKALVAELPYDQRKQIYGQEYMTSGGAMLRNAIPFVYLGSWRQGDILGAVLGMGASLVAGGLVGYSELVVANQGDEQLRGTLTYTAGIIALGAYAFGIIEPVLYTIWYNRVLSEALELRRKDDQSTEQQLAQKESGYVFDSPPTTIRIPVTLVRYEY